MAGGLHYDSVADLPPALRKQLAQKLLAANQKTASVAGPSESLKKQKYRNIEVEIEKIHFKSKKEAARYAYLKMLLDRGIIRDLRLQREYTLQEAFTTAAGERVRSIRYITDFTYRVDRAGYDLLARGVASEDIEYWRDAIAQHGPGVEIIEDTKSRPTKTPQYRMKYKMMADHGYHVREL